MIWWNDDESVNDDGESEAGRNHDDHEDHEDHGDDGDGGSEAGRELRSKSQE